MTELILKIYDYLKTHRLSGICFLLIVSSTSAYLLFTGLA